MPFYNAESTLSDAIESILRQTYPFLEVILVNNNSTDSSKAIAEKFATGDQRIIITNEQEQGIVAALNNGCKKATGKYIARMDADDISFPERLEKQVHFLEENSGYGLVGGEAEYKSFCSEDTKGLQRYVTWSNNMHLHEQIIKKQFVESPFIHPTVMFRKKLGVKFGFYRKGNFPEDYELLLRWLEAGVKMHKLNKKVLQWKDFQKRLTRKHKNYSEEAFYRIKSDYLSRWLLKNNPHFPNVHIWGASKISRKRVRLLETYGIKVKAYIDIKKTRRLKEPVILYTEIPPPAEAFILVYMKHEHVRQEIQSYLESQGYAEGLNYLLLS